jgi:hypothetical protein
MFGTWSSLSRLYSSECVTQEIGSTFFTPSFTPSCEVAERHRGANVGTRPQEAYYRRARDNPKLDVIFNAKVIRLIQEFDTLQRLILSEAFIQPSTFE